MVRRGWRAAVARPLLSAVADVAPALAPVCHRARSVPRRWRDDDGLNVEALREAAELLHHGGYPLDAREACRCVEGRDGDDVRDLRGNRGDVLGDQLPHQLRMGCRDLLGL